MAKGWSAPAIRQCRLVVDLFKRGWTPADCPDKVLAWPIGGAKQGSRNHEAQVWGSSLALAAMFGTREEYQERRAVVLAWLELERKQGLWRTEQLCAGTHAAQHANGIVCATIGLVVAEQRWGPDPELRAAIEWYWRSLWALLDAISTPGGGVVGPGSRQPKGPNLAPLADVQRERLAMLVFESGGGRQIKHKGGLARKPKPGKPYPWATDFYTYADGFRELLARNAIPLDAAPTLPKLRQRMTIYRGDDWHYAEVEPPQGHGRGEWTRWTLCSHKAHDKGRSPLAGVTWGAGVEAAPDAPVRRGERVVTG